jgi:MoxR-like ATPase
MSHHKILEDFQKHASELIVAQDQVIKFALMAFLVEGHCLIEDAPGKGKTSLALVFSKLLGLEMKRIQFTADLMPSDILGTNIFRPHQGKFEFISGPLFSQFILADEMNRAPAKTQSALLEAMEEKKVTIEGILHPLPTPFMIMATQNPMGDAGTFSLPESQLDRFTLGLTMLDLSLEDEIQVLKNPYRKDKLNQIRSLLSTDALKEIIHQVKNVAVSSTLMQEIATKLVYLRQERNLTISTRAALDLVKISKAHAFLNNRNYVIPEDVQQVLPFVFSHRSGQGNKIHESIAYLKNLVD